MSVRGCPKRLIAGGPCLTFATEKEITRMRSSLLMKNRGWTGSAVLLGTLALTAGSLVAWKHASVRKADAAGARPPEAIETGTPAGGQPRHHCPPTAPGRTHPAP